MRPVFPGQRLMRLEFLHGRMDPPRLGDGLRQVKRADSGAGAFHGCYCDPQRLPAGAFRCAGEILRHDTDARRFGRGTRQQFTSVGHR